jgi:hypothetical protein
MPNTAKFVAYDMVAHTTVVLIGAGKGVSLGSWLVLP